MTREQLLEDLYKAYYDARRHKRNKPYQLRFEAHLDENLNQLCDELLNRTYKPLVSDCFIINEPKCREVFAAHFRDRVVHHLYFNYTHEMFERTFIYDSYSCIKHRGTHFGVNRLRKHILEDSHSYSRPCYVLKMDIRGYFMSIDRHKLLEIALKTLDKMGNHRVGCHRPTLWKDVVDMDFVRYLTAEIILLNPIDGCRFIGPSSDWDNLPYDKSLFHSAAGCGLPIGNLTSQLFSNVYLNVLDQFVKRELRCKHYGRYVDDFYVVSSDFQELCRISDTIKRFLHGELHLVLHEGKTIVRDIKKGIEFLGAFLLPYRIYIRRTSVLRMAEKISNMDFNEDPIRYNRAMDSFCGIMSHWNNFRLRKWVMSC